MRDRSGALPTKHSPGVATAPLPPAAVQALARLERALLPAAWSDDDNKPVIPRIPGQRKPTAKTVTHANGLEFRIIDGASNYARVARNVRQLVMADGSEWTVGLPVGWRGIEAAWKTAETPEEEAARLHAYGQSMARRDRIQVGLHIAIRTAVGA